MTDESVSAEISAIATELDFGDSIRQYATVIADELQHQETRISSSQRTAAACLLAACRLREEPVRVTVIADQTPFSKEQILSEMQRLSQALEITVPLADPEILIEKSCDELGLPEIVRERAVRLAQLGDDASVTSGVSPYTYTAAILYVVCSPTDVDLSQADIASHFDVSTATLRNRRDDILAATGSRLFEIQFPDARSEAVSLVDELLAGARTSDWAQNKRSLGILGGAWLYVANAAEINTSATELATITGVSEPTIRARYEEFVDYVDTAISPADQI
ncbi:transcription initiation factor IIB family protein (plasmid) [Natrinema zhouii]|uniref:transcription initiation factor IIB family protein n=1 Tax=Natrinema zhouii TaxID=1710539 RepID=UPI001CFF67DC|nr:transcription initiation factor IIB family protein [Natrinema zhouii]UHQ98674.1 transcription initiation factor IIB family protein [Natrinema zhouii]